MTARAITRRGTSAAKRRGVGNASGIAIPAAPSGWTRTLTDDFDTPFAAGGVSSAGAFPSPYTTNFVAYADGTLDTSGNNNGSNSVYNASTNLRAFSSRVEILHNVTGGGQIRGAAFVLQPGGVWGQTSGRFTVCYRVQPAGGFHGFKMAFLLWPVSEVWPRDSEIDWPEGSLASGGVFGANMLHQGSTTFGSTDFDHHRYGTTPSPDGSWHTATIEWLSGTFVRALWDGVELGTMLEAVPNTAMRWTLQSESDVDQFGTAGYATTGDTGTIEVDWVTVESANSPATPGAGAAPSSTAVVTEPFTGTSGAWSGNWSVSATSGASAALSTNQGLQTTGVLGGYADKVHARLTTNLPTDFVLAATLNITTTAEAYPYIAFRDVASGTGLGGYTLYFYTVSGTGSALQLASPAISSIWFSQQATAWTTSTVLKVEILVVSNIASIRYWAAAGSRPTNPQMRTNVSAYAGPTCGLGLTGGSAAASTTCRWDDFSIASVP